MRMDAIRFPRRHATWPQGLFDTKLGGQSEDEARRCRKAVNGAHEVALHLVDNPTEVRDLSVVVRGDKCGRLGTRVHGEEDVRSGVCVCARAHWMTPHRGGMGTKGDARGFPSWGWSGSALMHAPRGSGGLPYPHG